MKTLSKFLSAAALIAAAVGLCAPIGWVLPASANTQVPKVPDGPAAQVQYQFQVLHGFGAPGDGVAAGGAVLMDSEGNLYGFTGGGGTYNLGTVYELSPTGNGQWTETILHSFQDNGTDGFTPTGVVIDNDGNVYGTTQFGGDG